MKNLVLIAIALMLALSLCLPVFADETAEVQKYGNIGRLSKLNISEDELNEVLKDIMVNSICNRYVFFDTMTDMLMALYRGDIVVLETDQNTVRYIAYRNDGIVDRPPYLNPNNLMFSVLLREEVGGDGDAKGRDHTTGHDGGHDDVTGGVSGAGAS